jgi:HEAT repeat protein
MAICLLVSLFLFVPTPPSPGAEGVDLLITWLKDKNPQKRAEAAKDLGFYDDVRSVDALICAIRNDNDENVQGYAVESLGMLGPTAKKAIPLLIAILKDKTKSISIGNSSPNERAARALIGIGPDAVVPLMEVAQDKQGGISIRQLALTTLSTTKGGARDVEARIIPLIVDAEEGIRMDAICACVALAPKSMAVKRAVLSALADTSEYVQVVAAAELHLLDPENVITVPVLIHHAKGRDKWTQWRAITELGFLGSKAKPAVPDLIKLVKAEDDQLRVAAVRALGRIGPDARESVPVLREALKDSDPSVRLNAFDSLNAIARKPR